MSQHCATFKCSMQRCSMKTGPPPMRSVGKQVAQHLGHDGRTWGWTAILESHKFRWAVFIWKTFIRAK